MLTVARKKNKDVKHTHNLRFFLASVIGASIALTAFNLDVPGQWLYSVGRTDLAAPCLKVATTFAREVHLTSQRTADALCTLAACEAKSKDYDKAINIEQDALNLYKAYVGEAAPQVFISNAHIASFLIAKGNNQRAEMILNDTAQQLDRMQIPDTEALAVVKATLADALLAQHKLPEAIPLLQELTAIDERYMMLKQKSVDAYDKLGMALRMDGLANAGKQMIEDGIRIKERILGAKNVQVASSYMKLSAVQTELGETAEAQKSLRHAQTIYRMN